MQREEWGAPIKSDGIHINMRDRGERWDTNHHGGQVRGARRDRIADKE